MVRKSAILIGVGATVAIGGAGYLAYHLRSNSKAVAVSSGEGVANGSVAPEPLITSEVQEDRSHPADGAAEATPDPLSAMLKGNEALLSEQERALVSELLQLDQGHLFEGWPEPGTADSSKRQLVDQLVLLHRSYHGGLPAYVRNAKKLLQESREGTNPFEGYVPSVPSGVRLDFGSPDYLA
ncbi:hypothetical protein Agub_g12510, partial [Astrephomene gubernaculifera]